MVDENMFNFMKGLLGTVDNISACPEGREFLVTASNGKELLQLLIKHLPDIPSFSAEYLKRFFDNI